MVDCQTTNRTGTTMKISLLEIQQKPELMKGLSKDEFQQAWEDLVKLSKDLDALEGLFLAEYTRRAKSDYSGKATQ